MRRLRVQILLSGGLVALAALISGCSGSPNYALIPTITPGGAVLMAGQTAQFTATESGIDVASPVWMVNGVKGGAASTGTVTASGVYTAPTGSAPPASVQLTVTDSAHSTLSSPVQISIFQQNHPQPGTVTSTINPLVANYAFQVPEGSTVQIQFGTTANYGLTTWTQPAPAVGGDVSILVAGMRASSTYHMQAIVHLPNGSILYDKDQSFTTGALPAGLAPALTVQQTNGMTPAAGVEMLDLINESAANALTTVVTDLSGNVIWYYPIQPLYAFPIKPLPNGHMLVVTSGSNQTGALANQVLGNAVQEIDLAGNVIYQFTAADIQDGLNGIGLPALTYMNMNHDVLKLPNGHLILLASFNQDVNGVAVTGNMLIDWDPVQGPVWTWSTFDHIPVTHAPYGVADLTHGNALLYSPDDGNLIVSLRDQNWIIKINYNNGVGDGSILWRLGPDGDFALPNGQAPIEWNYGQHYLSLFSSNSSGIFSMMFFNNGNNRMVDANNDICGTGGQIPCYSSVPVYQLDESAMTAQVSEEANLSPTYSICCGSTGFLSNGDLEYDIAFDYADGSFIQEVTHSPTPQLVWQMSVAGQLAYRGFRIGSMYPGVEWTQAAIAAANVNATPSPAQKPLVKKAGPWPIP